MTIMSSIDRPGRLYFLDTIRSFIIFFVILQHVALICSVGGIGKFSQSVFGTIVSLTDVFMMPIMFFIAGYFAPRSIDSKGAAAFIAGKFKRIWLPWFAGVMLLIPISLYFMYRVRNAGGDTEPMSYFAYWLAFMKNAATFPTGRVASPDSFSHRHLWFLSNLFVFFLVYSLISTIARNMKSKTADANSARKPLPVGVVLALAVVLSGLGYFAMSMMTTWGYRALLIAGLIHFEPSRTVVYVVYFTMGVYAYRKNWFETEWQSAGFSAWLPVSVIILGVYSYIVIADPFEMSTSFKLGMSMMRSLLCMALFGALVSGGLAYWNKPGDFSEYLSRNSYTVYIIHYPIHAALMAALMALSMPILIKAAILYILTAYTSWWLSDRVVGPNPMIAVVLGCAVNVLMMIIF